MSEDSSLGDVGREHSPMSLAPPSSSTWLPQPAGEEMPSGLGNDTRHGREGVRGERQGTNRRCCGQSAGPAPIESQTAAHCRCVAPEGGGGGAVSQRENGSRCKDNSQRENGSRCKDNSQREDGSRCDSGARRVIKRGHVDKGGGRSRRQHSARACGHTLCAQCFQQESTALVSAPPARCA